MKILAKLPSLYKVFSHLSKRERLIFYGAIFFVLGTLLDRTIISPIFSKLKSLDKAILEKETSIRKNMRILAQKDRIISENAKYAQFLSKMKSEDEEITSLLKEIETLANKTAISLIDMKPTGLKSSGFTKKYLVNLNCEAQMEQLIDFMYNIESSSKLLVIEKYQITPKSKESSVTKCSMSIAKIFIP